MQDKFVIPKSVELLDQTINIVYKDDMTDKEDIVGRCRYRTNEIEIQEPKKHNMPDDQVIRTYFHELVHFILDVMKEEELNKKEEFVDTLAGYIYQSIKTSKY